MSDKMLLTRKTAFLQGYDVRSLPHGMGEMMIFHFEDFDAVTRDADDIKNYRCLPVGQNYSVLLTRYEEDKEAMFTVLSVDKVKERHSSPSTERPHSVAKYRFDGRTKRTLNDRIVKGIVALRDFADVKAGDKGGYIEYEDNLSHDGDCWVYPKGIVSERAKVREDARIVGGELVGHAMACGSAEMYDHAKMSGHSVLRGNAKLAENAMMMGDALAEDCSYITGHATAGDGAHFKDYSMASGYAIVVDMTLEGRDKMLYDEVFYDPEDDWEFER